MVKVRMVKVTVKVQLIGKIKGNNFVNFSDHPINFKIVIQGNISGPKIIIIRPELLLK